MAEETAEQQPVEDKKAARPGSKSLVLIIIILVVALAGGGAAYLLLFANKGGPEGEAKQEQKKDTKTALIPVDPFVLNLAEHGRFLKVAMQFEIADAANQTLVTERMPQLRDAIITLMGSKSAETVASPEGKFQLKDELLLRANQAVGKDVFKNLYFTEFVMQ